MNAREIAEKHFSLKSKWSCECEYVYTHCRKLSSIGCPILSTCIECGSSAPCCFCLNKHTPLVIMECHALSAPSSKRIDLTPSGSMCEKAAAVESIPAEDVHTKIRTILSKEHVGYVLMTCKKPKSRGADRGKMEVQISYEGDPILASYLVESAQDYIDQNVSLGDES